DRARVPAKAASLACRSSSTRAGTRKHHDAVARATQARTAAIVHRGLRREAQAAGTKPALASLLHRQRETTMPTRLLSALGLSLPGALLLAGCASHPQRTSETQATAPAPPAAAAAPAPVI